MSDTERFPVIMEGGAAARQRITNYSIDNAESKPRRSARLIAQGLRSSTRMTSATLV